MHAHGEHVPWEVREGHSLQFDRLYCLVEQSGQQKAVSTLVTYKCSVDSGGTSISPSWSFSDFLRTFSWFHMSPAIAICLQNGATSKMLMGLPGRKTCIKVKGLSKQRVQMHISFAPLPAWRQFWSCMCWTTWCRSIWAGSRSSIAMAMAFSAEPIHLGTNMLFCLRCSKLLKVNASSQFKDITIIYKLCSFFLLHCLSAWSEALGIRIKPNRRWDSYLKVLGHLSIIFPMTSLLSFFYFLPGM